MNYDIIFVVVVIHTKFPRKKTTHIQVNTLQKYFASNNTTISSYLQLFSVHNGYFHKLNQFLFFPSQHRTNIPSKATNARKHLRKFTELYTNLAQKQISFYLFLYASAFNLVMLTNPKWTKYYYGLQLLPIYWIDIFLLHHSKSNHEYIFFILCKFSQINYFPKSSWFCSISVWKRCYLFVHNDNILSYLIDEVIGHVARIYIYIPIRNLYHFIEMNKKINKIKSNKFYRCFTVDQWLPNEFSEVEWNKIWLFRY